MRVHLTVTSIDSSNISRIDFLEGNAKLFDQYSKGFLRITFNSGARYVYEEVPFSVAMKILASQSIGQGFNDYVKTANFKYHKE